MTPWQRIVDALDEFTYRLTRYGDHIAFGMMFAALALLAIIECQSGPRFDTGWPQPEDIPR